MSPSQTHRHACLSCGYDLAGIPQDSRDSGGWRCPECGRLNLPSDYYLALQHIMGPKSWIATVIGLTLLNVSVCIISLAGGRAFGVAFAFGFLACLVESALVCGLAGRRAHVNVKVEKMMLLAGALCCFTLVGTLLAAGLILTFTVGHF